MKEYGEFYEVKSARKIMKVVPVRLRENPIQKIFKTCLSIRTDNFMTFLESLPEVYRRNIGEIETPWRFPRLARYLGQGKVIGVGDASVEDARSSHAYILESTDEEVSVQGVAPIDNDPDDASSNRTESCSVVAMLTLATAVSLFYDVDTPRITIYSDNKEAIHNNLRILRTDEIER